MWGRGPRGNNATCSAFCRLSVTSAITHKQIGPFWCWFLSEWVSICSRTLLVSKELFYEAVSFSRHPKPHWFLQPEVLRLSFPTLTLDCEVCLTPQLFLLVYPHTNVGQPAPPATALPALVCQLLPCCVFFAPLPVSAPPTTLNECFFFNSFVVRLPFSSIFWQFWLCFCF